MVEGVLNFPLGFDVAGFMLAWSSEVPQLISLFLKNGINPHIAIELVCT